MTSSPESRQTGSVARLDGTPQGSSTGLPTESSNRLTRLKLAKTTLRVVSNHAKLNCLSVPAETLMAMVGVLAQFPPEEVRAALASVTNRTAAMHLDEVLRVLADRLWRTCELPPPEDEALGEIWDHIWRNKPDGWSHEAIRRTVDRYGWEALYGQESETASVRKAQVREMYRQERERHVSVWIARVSLAAEGLAVEGAQ